MIYSDLLDFVPELMSLAVLCHEKLSELLNGGFVFVAEQTNCTDVLDHTVHCFELLMV